MLSSGRTSDRHRPEQQKYLKWCVEEKKKGLVDIKLFVNPFKPVGLSEEIFKELNEINEIMGNGEVETENGFF